MLVCSLIIKKHQFLYCIINVLHQNVNITQVSLMFSWLWNTRLLFVVFKTFIFPMEYSFFVSGMHPEFAKHNKTHAFVMILLPEFAKQYKTNAFVMFWIQVHNISTQYQYTVSAQYQYTVQVRSISTQYQYTVLVHITSTRYQYTVPVHSISTQYLSTASVHGISPQHQYTVSVHSIST